MAYRRRYVPKTDINMLRHWFEAIEHDGKTLELTDVKMALHVRHKLYYVRNHDRETFVAMYGVDDDYPLSRLRIAHSKGETKLLITWDVMIQAGLEPKPAIDAEKAWNDCQIRMMKRAEAEMAKRGLVNIIYDDLAFPKGRK
jgi:hypothetical protein